MLTALLERRHRRRGDEARRVPLRQQAVRSRRDDAARREGARDHAAAPRGPHACAPRQAQPFGLDSIVGDSAPIVAVRALLQKIAASPASTVLLTGESGTGKDLAAKVIHYSSNRASQAVHEHHVLGAARDAARERAVRPRTRRVHRRRSAEARPDRDRPTAARCSSTRSARWCRCCRPSCCGFSRRRRSSASAASSDIKVDVRVIAATNRIARGRGEEGPLPRGPVLPPQRDADAAAAAARAARRHPAAAQPLHRQLSTPSSARRCAASLPARLARCKTYGWPGNVRELRNAVERAMLLTDGDRAEATNTSRC